MTHRYFTAFMRSQDSAQTEFPAAIMASLFFIARREGSLSSRRMVTDAICSWQYFLQTGQQGLVLHRSICYHARKLWVTDDGICLFLRRILNV